MQGDISTKGVTAVVALDPKLRKNLCNALRESGFSAWSDSSIKDFSIQSLREKADLLVVDIDALQADELRLARRLAAEGLPIVVVAEHSFAYASQWAPSSPPCYTKPVDLNRLVNGVWAHLQYTRLIRKESRPSPLPRCWELDASSHHLIAPNLQAVALTSREFEFLGYLAAAHGGLVAKRDLARAIGIGAALDGGTQRIDAHLSRLRRKVLASVGMPLPVHSVFGQGLAFIAGSSHGATEADFRQTP
ncbi:hypothetical protein GCM10027082_14460 [Comamonas humi]